MQNLPWDDCKIAFGYMGNDDDVWEASERGMLNLPEGWRLVETDCAGARVVIVFRVTGLPTVADGEIVQAALKSVFDRNGA